MNIKERKALYAQYMSKKDFRFSTHYEKMKELFLHFNNGDDFEEQKKKDFIALVNQILRVELTEIDFLMTQIKDE